jgi:hypothetical protein
MRFRAFPCFLIVLKNTAQTFFLIAGRTTTLQKWSVVVLLNFGLFGRRKNAASQSVFSSTNKLLLNERNLS